MVEEGGFEPPKRIATDLQSAPFGHSGTPPYEIGPPGKYGALFWEEEEGDCGCEAFGVSRKRNAAGFF